MIRRAKAARRSAAGWLAGLAAASLAGAQPGTPPAEEFSGELVVHEASVLVDPAGERRLPAARDLAVREGERLYEVTAVEPVERGEWHLVVYVDDLLATRDGARLALLALARAAARLAETGSTEILLAGEDGVAVELGPSREAPRLAEVLAAVAGRRPGRDALATLRRPLLADEPLPAAAAQRLLAEERALVAGRLELLAEATAGRCDEGPCALLLVVDGFLLRPEQLYGEISAGEGNAAPAGSLEAPLEGLGRRLAAGGWTVVALPLRELDLSGATGHDLGDYDRFLADVGAESGGLPIVRGRGRRRTAALPAAALDVLVLPRYEPLRRLVTTTAGELARAPEEVGDLVARLGNRQRVWFRRPAPLPEEPWPVEVLGPGGPLRSPAWAAAAKPEPSAAPAGERR